MLNIHVQKTNQMTSQPLHTLILLLIMYTTGLDAQNSEVKVKILRQVFPTYNMGPDDPNAYFKDFRIPGMSFFRSSRSVYPYTFQHDYRPGRKDVEYEVVRLENNLVYVDIIPQLRGRIQGAIDKRNGWDFLYYNHVIKPAEIAVRSAWISGGLEYNHPQGHGYTQFNRISYDILEREDGSKTVVIAEIEPVRMMKWEFEITLRPDKLYIETRGRLISIEPFPVPFLSSNNAAIHATDEMELIYPQESYASGHGFREMKKWAGYSPDGTDWSRVKNIKRVLSIFADGTGLLADYWGTYSHDEGIDAGTVIVADHRVAPGKKYFTWGTHPGGKQWDHFLSDEDGGYVELQQQAYYTNLGYGYAVLDPFEVKEFTIYFYPVKNTGGFVAASKEVVLNFKRVEGSKARLDLQPTLNIPEAVIQVYRDDVQVASFTADLVVGEVYHHELDVASSEDDTLKVRILDGHNRELLFYADHIDEVTPCVNRIPDKPLADYTIDQLYAKAIADYHDAYGTDADLYTAEMLSRDSLESRANRLSGIMAIKRGQSHEAISYLKRSLVNDHFENCYRSWFLMGYAYLQLGLLEQAHQYLVQSSRKRAELDHSLYYLAQVELLKKEPREALRLLQQIPLSGATHPDVFNLMAYTLRKLGEDEMASSWVQRSFETDPLNFTGYIEKLELSDHKEAVLEKINFLFDRRDRLFLGSQVYIETAIHYMELGDHAMALKVLDIAGQHYGQDVYPFLDYYRGYCLLKTGREGEALTCYRKASAADQTYVFPYRRESLAVLESVLAHDPGDAVALMYYGDLLYYLRRHDEAIGAWEKSHATDPANHLVSRNLAIGKYVRSGHADEATRLLEEAFGHSGRDPRIYAELEALYISQGRFDKLESHYDDNREIILQKGDYALKAVDFYLSRKRFGDASSVLRNAYFSPAEKALGKPVRHARYVETQIGLAQGLMEGKEYGRAIDELRKAYEYPDYLQETEVNHPVTARLDYHLAMAYRMNKDEKRAEEYFRRAIGQEISPFSVAAIYKAKALKETGQQREAGKMVRDMLDTLHREDPGSGAGIDDYVRSLAHAFLGEKEKAADWMHLALEKDFNVVMEARYESSYLPQNKAATE
jgi:tetratricopeptide (TPR) repeat protein